MHALSLISQVIWALQTFWIMISWVQAQLDVLLVLMHFCYPCQIFFFWSMIKGGNIRGERDYESNKFTLEALRSEMQETEAVHIFKVKSGIYTCIQ